MVNESQIVDVCLGVFLELRRMEKVDELPRQSVQERGGWFCERNKTVVVAARRGAPAQGFITSPSSESETARVAAELVGRARDKGVQGAQRSTKGAQRSKGAKEQSARVHRPVL